MNEKSQQAGESERKHPLGLGWRRVVFDVSRMMFVLFLVMYAVSGLRSDLVTGLGCLAVHLLARDWCL